MKNTRVNIESEILEASFVPEFLKTQYVRNANREYGDGLSEEFAVILWVDIGNFSPLCNRLMKDPASGVEAITKILNRHYQFVSELAVLHGGQPLYFVGDGVLFGWPSQETDLASSFMHAIDTAREILSNKTTADDLGNVLSLHCVVSGGAWQMAELEGIHGTKHLSFYGEVFERLANVSANRRPDEVLLARVISDTLPELHTEILDEHSVVVREFPQPQNHKVLDSQKISSELWPKLRPFLPRNLTVPLSEEQLSWMAEIRPVNSIFIKFRNIGKDNAENLVQLREIARLSAASVLKYDGLLNQVWMDEKESNILICFGPSPSSHFDNAARSVKLAFELNKLLNEAGFENCAGVCSGMAYCGIIGTSMLRQHTIIGDVVNLSARLASMRENGIYCDQSTMIATKDEVLYGPPVSRSIKGHTEAVTVYTPEAILDRNYAKSNTLVSFGRDAELNELRTAFGEAANGKSSVYMLVGESGIGKSRLLQDFVQMPETSGRVLFNTCDFINRNTPYSAWANIFNSVFQLDKTSNEPERQSKLISIENRFGNNCSLLNDVLHAGLHESDVTRGMTASQRVAAVHDLLLEVLRQESETSALAFVFDNAQFVDDVSRKLIQSVQLQLEKCLIVLSAPTIENSPSLDQILSNGARVMSLSTLDDNAQKMLICSKLRVDDVSPELFDLIRKVSKGNPFFIVELTGSLNDKELLHFENGKCMLAPGAEIDENSMPETVRGAVRMRIDQLDAGSKLVLKVGSVAGERFANKLVNNIYPIESERESVPDYLKEAEHSGFIHENIVDALSGYYFNNLTISDVAYEMTLSEQKRHLHSECAIWYEENFKQNLDQYYVRLAHHWEEAGDKVKASKYLEREAIRLFRLGYITQAVNTGIAGLKMLQFELETNPEAIVPKIGENMGAIAGLMADKTIEELVDHKPLADENTEQLIHLLLELEPLIYVNQQPELFALVAITCLRLTLEQGNGNSAAEVYGMYSVIHKGMTGDSLGAYAWSNLSIAVDNKNNNTLQARVTFLANWFIAIWVRPYRELIQTLYPAAEAGFASGDILYACFAYSTINMQLAYAGFPLDEVIAKARKHSVRINNMVKISAYQVMLEEQVASALKGDTDSPTSLTNEKYNEERDIASICTTDMYNQIAYYLIFKLKLNTHFGYWKEGVEWGDKAWAMLPAFANQMGHMELAFYYTIAALNASVDTDGESGEKLKGLAISNIEQMKAWAVICPENFAHKLQILQGILEGLSGSTELATELFRTAVDLATEQQYLQDIGIAWEFLARMQKTHVIDHKEALKEAIMAYRNWGANAKIDYLNRLFS